MPLPSQLQNLRLPVVAAPLFIISNPKLVIAQCKAGIVGSFPALNARPAEQLEEWLKEITEELDRHNQANPDNPAAPWAMRWRKTIDSPHSRTATCRFATRAPCRSARSVSSW